MPKNKLKQILYCWTFQAAEKHMMLHAILVLRNDVIYVPKRNNTCSTGAQAGAFTGTSHWTFYVLEKHKILLLLSWYSETI